ncbi:MAG: hypothetical protein A2X66_06150 [Ignavibacteria bacterium GWA2_54_16]|nr:MAG: hypothetical protein A2X66_06150 [Ignavibacteria bacterium GWA2_54_16]
MLSSDLAELYKVQPKVLMQAVKRNPQRFPEDFMFRLSPEETQAVRHSPLRSRSQIVTLKRGQNVKYVPYAFTEQGIAMLSSVLRSNTAIQVNIAIMRAFVRLREILLTHKDLMHKLEELERKYETHDRQIHGIFEAIRQVMSPEPKDRTLFCQRKSLVPVCENGLTLRGRVLGEGHAWPMMPLDTIGDPQDLGDGTTH